MHAESHSTVREGLFVGLLGGAAVAAWWFLVDVLAGTPLATPNGLGQVFIEGERPPGPGPIDTSAVVAYAVVHFALFAVLGLALERLVHLVSERWELRMGLWIGIVVAAAGLIFGTYALSRYTGYALPLWATLGGAVVGIGTMLATTWSRHPLLRQSFRQVPLADEVETPPAPPASAPPRS
jgi:hypothetical protein